MQSKYKILSLDGGGTWAILQVLTLQEIFNKKYPDKEIRGHEVLRHFDLVIANSGGSMVLAALACDWTFEKIITMFEDQTKINQIFTPLSFRDRYFPANFMHLFGIRSIGPRYSTTNKKKALKEMLVLDSGKKLYDISLLNLPRIIGKESLEIIVATFDIKNNRARFFRSNKFSKARVEVVAGHSNFDEINLVNAIHGSSNAPVNYFDFPAIISPKRTRKRFYLWDGALGGFNNPIMAGITEALLNGILRKNIRVLSIGTSSKVNSNEDSAMFAGTYYKALLGRKLSYDKDRYGNILGINFSKTLRKRRYSRLFKGSALFISAMTNVSQSILFEPQAWATYSAYVHLFSEEIDAPENNANFIRLSPQLFLDKNPSLLVKRLYDLDMDLTKPEDIADLKGCFEQWKKGEIINEPIQWTKTVEGEYIYARGHRYFKDAINAINWL